MKFAVAAVVLLTCAVLLQESDAWLFWRKRGFEGATPDDVAKARQMFKEMDDAVKSGQAGPKRAVRQLEELMEEEE